MRQTNDPYAEEPGGQARRASHTISLPQQRAQDLQHLLEEQADELDRRLEAGMRELHEAARDLLRQVTGEVWRAAGPEAGADIRRNVLLALSRDAGLRELLSRTDERFRALATRFEQLEGAVRQLAEATRDAVRQSARRSPETALPETGVPSEAGAGRLEAAIQPISLRLTELSEGLLGAQAQQRDDLMRLARGIAKALGEMANRNDRAFRSLAEERSADTEALRALARRPDTNRQALEELERSLHTKVEALESAVTGEAARSGQAAAELERSLRDLAQQTASIVEESRKDLAGRIQTAGGTRDALERVESAAGSMAARVEGTVAELASRLEAIERAHSAQREALSTYIERTGRGLGEVSRRIQEGFRSLAERTRDAGTDGLASLEAALQLSVRDLKRSIEGITVASGTALGDVRADLSERVERARSDAVDEARAVSRLVADTTHEQERALASISNSLHTLVRSVREAGQDQTEAVERIVWAFAGRQEALLDESLASLKTSVEALRES